MARMNGAWELRRDGAVGRKKRYREADLICQQRPISVKNPWISNPTSVTWTHQAGRVMKRKVKQMRKRHGWMGARLGEGWKRKLKRHYGDVRGNKWVEEEEERTMMKRQGRSVKDKDGGIDSDIGEREKMESVCPRWGLTLFTLRSVCIGANQILHSSFRVMLGCRVGFYVTLYEI